jgi:hypothetical protein
MSTAWEKFQGATLSLARSGSLKDRLDEAYRNYLAYVLEDDVPKEAREGLKQMHIAIRRQQPTNRSEDCVRATIRKLSNDEAEQMAETIVTIFSMMPRTVPMLVRNYTPAQVISLYSPEEAEDAEVEMEMEAEPVPASRKHSV